MKIVVDDKIPFIKDELEPYADVEYYPGKEITRQRIKDADALIIRTRTICNADLLEGTSVKFIASATIGFDHIDSAYCQKKGIAWTNAPGCNSGSVMQYIAAALLYWAKEECINLEDRVLGVIGIGNVGSKIVRLAESLGLQVLLNDPPRERETGACGYISLNGILREADIITLHVPLNLTGDDRTFHLVDIDFLARLNPNSLLVNTSRGEVVNQRMLNAHYSAGKPAQYIFDVWENEPEINPQILSNSYLSTPHIAGYSADGKANGTQMSVQALSRFFDLGIDDWEPADIPQPESPELSINCEGKNFQEVATELVLKTYPIIRDSNYLREKPIDFEKLRGEYPLRREFHAYTVIAENISEDFTKRLRRIGFKIE